MNPSTASNSEPSLEFASDAVAAIPADTVSDPKAPRKTAKLIFRLVLTAGLLVLLFWQVRWQDVWKVVGSIDRTLLFWACLWWFPTQYLQFFKWEMMAKQAGDDVSKRDIRRGYWVGFTLGLITPGRVGQFGRALALHNCSLSRAAGLTIIERGYQALVINSFGMLALVALPLMGWVPPIPFTSPYVNLLLLAGGLGLLVLGIFPRISYGPLSWLAGKLPLREKSEKALAVLDATTTGRGIVLIVLSLASTATSLFQFVLLVKATGAEIPIFAGMLAGLLTFFIKGALPISLGSLGVGEWTSIYCFQGLGVEPSAAVAASLLLFTINVFIPSLIGLPFIQYLRTPNWPKPKVAASS